MLRSAFASPFAKGGKLSWKSPYEPARIDSVQIKPVVKGMCATPGAFTFRLARSYCLSSNFHFEPKRLF